MIENINNGESGLSVRNKLNEVIQVANDGIPGAPGTSGTSGTSGADGTSGTSGADGTSGTSGADGTSGTSGTSGVDGTSGTSGGQGPTGPTGPTGPAGTSGTSGTSGGGVALGPADFWSEHFPGRIGTIGLTNDIISYEYNVSVIGTGGDFTGQSDSGYGPLQAFRNGTNQANSGAALVKMPNTMRTGALDLKWLLSFRMGTTDNAKAYMGMHTSQSATEPSNGIYFEITGNNIKGVTANDGTRSNTSNYTLTTGNFYTITCSVNAALTSAVFEIYADNNPTPVFTQTLTTNIPTSDRLIGASAVAAYRIGGVAQNPIISVQKIGHGTIAGFNKARG